MKITGKTWQKSTRCSGSGSCFMPNGIFRRHQRRSKRFSRLPGVFTRLWKTARIRALRASEQNGIEKPGTDPRFSVFLAALAGLCCPF